MSGDLGDAVPHNEPVDLVSVQAQTARVDVSRAEALALLNLLREANRLPPEIKGPPQIFERLESALDGLLNEMYGA